MIGGICANYSVSNDSIIGAYIYPRGANELTIEGLCANYSVSNDSIIGAYIILH